MVHYRKSATPVGTGRRRAPGALTMTETTASSKATLEAGGMLAEAPHEPTPFSEGSYVCAGDEMTVAVDGGTTVLRRAS